MPASARTCGLRVAPVTAYSYERVSSAQQVSGRGLLRQGDAAQRWAQQQGITLDTTLELSDRGRSASKGHHLSKGALGRFLALAQAGQLGPDPILLVEAIDRLSRQEPLDAIETILTGLVGSGVRIITLEDGAEYSRQTLRTDPTKLLVLVVKMQAAYEYSARLGQRIADSWASARSKLEQGILSRPGQFCPAWCRWSPEQGYVVDESKAAVVRTAFDLLLHQGCYATAKQLNAQGLLSPAGNRWTAASVRSMAANADAVYGAIRLNSRRHGSSRPEQLIEGMLPVIVTKDVVMTVRAAMAERAKTTGKTGPNGAMRWIAQGLTYCVCGSRMGLTTGGTAPHRILYLRCRHGVSNRGGCRQASVPVDLATAHLLMRLRPEQLNQLVEAASSSNADHQRQVDHWAAQVAQLRRQQVNTSAALKQAAKAGVSLTVLLEAQQEVTSALQDAERYQREAEHQLRLSSGTQADMAPVQAFRESFATGGDTAQQRQAVNRALKAMGLTVVLQGTGRLMGLRLAGSEPQWQPIRPLDRRLLWAGRTVHHQAGVIQELSDTDS